MMDDSKRIGAAMEHDQFPDMVVTWGAPEIPASLLHLLVSGPGSAPRRRESSVEEESTRRVVD